MRTCSKFLTSRWGCQAPTLGYRIYLGAGTNVDSSKFQRTFEFAMQLPSPHPWIHNPTRPRQQSRNLLKPTNFRVRDGAANAPSQDTKPTPAFTTKQELSKTSELLSSRCICQFLLNNGRAFGIHQQSLDLQKRNSNFMLQTGRFS